MAPASEPPSTNGGGSPTQGRACRHTGWSGSLTAAQRKALCALQEGLLAFALDSAAVDAAHASNANPPPGPMDPIVAATPDDEAAEAELLAGSRDSLLRFLRNQDFDVMSARALAIEVCRWRAAVRPWEVTPEHIPVSLPSGTWRWGGHTKTGMPIILVDVAAWRPSEYANGIDEYTRMVGYMMEGAVGRMGPGVERCAMIWSMAGWTSEMMKPIAVRCAARLLHIWQTMYPERVGAIFLCSVARLFQGYFYRVLRPWFQHRFLSNIHFLGPNPTSALQQHINLDQLPERLGKTFLGGQHLEFPVPCRSCADEIDAFAQDCGGPDGLPAAPASMGSAPIAAAKEEAVDAAQSGTCVGEIDLAQGRARTLDVRLTESTVSVEWHFSGDMHGVAIGYKVLCAGWFGASRVLTEGRGSSTPRGQSPSAGDSMSGRLEVDPAWGAATLSLSLYLSYARQDVKTLRYTLGVEAA